jgi:hypothetical protein
VGPVRPRGPVPLVVPRVPDAPVLVASPVGPVDPVGPCSAEGPTIRDPSRPVDPVGPVSPHAPVLPVAPVSVVNPVGPVGPRIPGPVGPLGPDGPGGPSVWHGGTVHGVVGPRGLYEDILTCYSTRGCRSFHSRRPLHWLARSLRHPKKRPRSCCRRRRSTDGSPATRSDCSTQRWLFRFV